jgi:predicted acetyltransferase
MPESSPPPGFEYVREPDVSDELDRELRDLLSGAFFQPHNAFFKERRYAQEQPRHRFLIRASEGRLLAHLAVHEKVISVGGADVAVGGMAEVCVHESARGRGFVRQLLERAHRELVESDIGFAFLFGDPNIYGSSGYLHALAPIRRLNHLTQEWETSVRQDALVKALTQAPWPEGPIDLRGPFF